MRIFKTINKHGWELILRLSETTNNLEIIQRNKELKKTRFINIFPAEFPFLLKFLEEDYKRMIEEEINLKEEKK